MNDTQIDKVIEKKKVDIFSLYKKEKLVHIEDDEGNFIDILLIKMTQGQRLSLLKTYNEYLEEQRIQLREREDKYHTLALAIEHYDTESIISGIISFELAQRGEISDFYPNLEGKTESEKKVILEDEYTKFRKSRRDDLLSKSKEELNKKFIDITIESQTLLDSVRILNYHSFVYMCFDPETKTKIFNSIEDVEKISDRRIIDTLTEEITKFRSLESSKEVRNIASQDASFLGNGESLKS